MNRFYLLHFTLAFFLSSFAPPICAQVAEEKPRRSQSVYIELAGAGSGITGNYEFRFKSEQTTGLGMRIGVGGYSFDIWGQSSLFSIPLELNYLVGREGIVAGEIGISLTYLRLKQDDFNWFSDSSSGYTTETLLLSYIPVGIRIRPPEKGFFFRFNVGPLINYGGSNLWSEHHVDPMIGIAMGYTFMK
jgi:hypothetical protein